MNITKGNYVKIPKCFKMLKMLFSMKSYKIQEASYLLLYMRNLVKLFQAMEIGLSVTKKILIKVIFHLKISVPFRNQAMECILPMTGVNKQYEIENDPIRCNYIKFIIISKCKNKRIYDEALKNSGFQGTLEYVNPVNPDSTWWSNSS